MVDIRILSALVATRQQDDQHWPTANEIQAVTRPMIDAHLGNAITHGPHIAEIAANGPIKSGMNPGYGLPILETGQPNSKSFALNDFKHGQSVIHR
jgi:hypothetical protein